MISTLKRYAMRRLALRGNVTHGRNLHVGIGSVVWAPQLLEIGHDVYIGKNSTIQIDGIIGDGVMIANNVGIIGKSDHDSKQIGKTIRASDWVGNHPQRLSLQTQIGSDVWIGFGAIILSGTRIGASSIIAAGSVVTSDVAPNAVVAGVSARQVGTRFSRADLQTHWSILANRGISVPVSDDEA